MSNVLFTSDLHLFHQKVAEIRGFSDVDEHNEAIARNWVKTVLPGDQVWVLGDNQAAHEQDALAFIAGLPGEKHLIAGNHDPVHSMHRNAHRKQRAYLDVFESVQTFARRTIDGREVLLSHFPYETDHTAEVRYSQYRLRNEGRWLLHGHTHSDRIMTSSREIHVGVDAWGLTPVPIHTIVKLIREQDARDVSADEALHDLLRTLPGTGPECCSSES